MTYEEKNDYRHQETERRLLWLEEHYSKFNDEFGDVKADVRWLVKFFWLVASSSIGALITSLINLLK